MSDHDACSFAEFAERQRGVPYMWGGGKDPFDCTGFVRGLPGDGGAGVTIMATGDVAAVTSPNGDTFTPALVTVPNIELIEVGEDWETSTGIFTFGENDLVAAIESQDDPAVRTPVIKLGHVDPRFDGQPTLGRISNLHLSNNNQTLCGDLEGVPQWLASVMFSAYPRRSIEGNFKMATRTGNLWDFVLTGVALLGDAYPAISTLEDIQALWGSEIPTLYPIEDVEEVAASGNFVRARRLTDVKWKSRKPAAADVAASSDTAAPEVQATLAVDDVRTAYYDSLGPAEAWWWIRAVLVNPLQLVVDDDAGNLWLIDVTTDADDNVSFGEPVSVKVEYVAASGQPVIRQQGQVIAATYQAPTDTGREVRAETQPDQEPQQEERTTVLSADALARLGLQPGASEDEISAAILAQASESGGAGDSGEGDNGDQPDDGNPQSQPETPATDPTAQPAETPQTETPPSSEVTVPEGMVLIDQTALETLQTGVAASNKLIEERATELRDKVINEACRAGKFSRSRVPHMQTLWAADPEGTRELISKLGEGVVPVEERGVSGETDPSVKAASEYPESWKPAVAAAGKSVGSSRIKVVGD